MQKSLLIILTFMSMSIKAQETQTNKHFWYSAETTASPQKIWQVWTDVPNWAAWDSGLKSAKMDGLFKINAKGKITSLENRDSNFKIVEFEDGVSYTFKSQLPLASLYVKRYLKTEQNKTIFTHEVWFSGPLGGLFAKQFGPKFRTMLPEVLNKIKKIAEK